MKIAIGLLFLALYPFVAQGFTGITKEEITSLESYVADLLDASKMGQPEIFFANLEKLMSKVPSTVTAYAAGISFGPRNDLYFAVTTHQFGNTYSLPLNPARRTNDACVYVSDKYVGPIVLITEQAVQIPTCDKRMVDNHLSYLPIKPLYSEGNNIVTSRPLGKTGSTSNYYLNDIFKKTDSFAIDPSKITKATIDGNMWILAGHFVETKYGMQKVKYFAPNVEVSLQNQRYTRVDLAGMSNSLRETSALLYPEIFGKNKPLTGNI